MDTINSVNNLPKPSPPHIKYAPVRIYRRILVKPVADPWVLVYCEQL